MSSRGPPRVLFAPASGAGVGGGHVLRDLALAQALTARGAACAVVVAPEGRRLAERFGEGALRILDLMGYGRAPALAAAADAVRPDVMVLDDYDLGASVAGDLRAPGRRLAVIDDLANRAYDTDLLIDPGYGRTPTDYSGRTPVDCRLCLGPRYALVRRRIAEAARSPPPPTAETVERVFVSFGLSDVGGVAARAVGRLRTLTGAHIDVALGADAASLPELRLRAADDPRLHLHPDARDVAALMQTADVAVGAGGSSTWERCALGLPTLAVVVVDNQRPVIEALARDGLMLAVELDDPAFDDRVAQAFEALRQPSLRARLSDAGRAICDGQGAARAAAAVLALI